MLQVFRPDLYRNVQYFFTGTNETDNFTASVYHQEQFLNKTGEPLNAKYLAEIDGTSNLTTVRFAPMFASKGNFY